MTTPPASPGPDAIKFLREEIRYENQQIANRVNYLSASFFSEQRDGRLFLEGFTDHL